MMWAIIEDGHRYFSKILMKQHFMVVEDGEDINFPMSVLDDIASSTHFQTPLLRPLFPAEWQLGKGGMKQKSDATTVMNTPQPPQAPSRIRHHHYNSTSQPPSTAPLQWCQA